MDSSEPVTQSASVPALPLPSPTTAVRLPGRRHRLWAVPLAVVGLGIGAAGLISSAVFVDRYADAPGDASDVNRRMSFDAVERYDPDGQILFVTVAGPHVTALQGVIGWLDPDVRFDTYGERFGDSTPEVQRRQNLASMRNAKDDAPYVALTKLGYPTELVPGAVIVDFVYCQIATSDQTDCAQFFPADEFFRPGDEILRIDGAAITTGDDISSAISTHRPGDTVEVVVRRAHGDPSAVDPANGDGGAAAGGDEVTGEVQLSADPDDPNRTIFGIRLADTTSVKLPFDVDIDTGEIGGPSAGLAFTLTLIDELTPGELTGDRKVAVTGTIDVEGNVGAIGGIRQKAAAVRREGGDAFIVPASQSPEEIADVRSILGADKVFPVATLDEALATLTKLGGNADSLGTPGAGYQPG